MKRILYLGTDPTHWIRKHDPCILIHYPVITLIPKTSAHPEIKRILQMWQSYTHLLFTSKNAVRFFFEQIYNPKLSRDKILIAIGTVTAECLRFYARDPDYIAEKETQEGVISLLGKKIRADMHILLPRSSLSRNVLVTFFEQQGIAHEAFDLYETRLQKLEPVPDLHTIDEIVFTSPSTVKGFLEIYGALPKDKILHAQGPITKETLRLFLCQRK